MTCKAQLLLTLVWIVDYIMFKVFCTNLTTPWPRSFRGKKLFYFCKNFSFSKSIFTQKAAFSLKFEATHVERESFKLSEYLPKKWIISLPHWDNCEWSWAFFKKIFYKSAFMGILNLDFSYDLRIYKAQ